MPTPRWPDADEKQLLELTHAGFSAGQIAKLHMPHYSRSAVIAKLGRLGVEGYTVKERPTQYAPPTVPAFYPPSPPRKFSWQLEHQDKLD